MQTYSAPAVRAHEVELEPRPYTQPAQQAALLEVRKEDLLAMDEAGLVTFAWEHLGLALDPSWTKVKMLTSVMRMAFEVVET